MLKGIKITIIVLCILVVLFGAVAGVYYWFPWHRNFFNNADKEFAIPGLADGFVPQGFTEIEGYNKYLISGYMDDGSPSRFYVVDIETKQVEKYVILKIDSGKNYDGHAGGVASYGSALWTVSMADNGKGYAFCFNAIDVINAENEDSIAIRDYFETYNNADCVFVQDDMLWVGEFYREKSHITDEEHIKTTSSGDVHKAMAYGFNIDISYKCGVKNKFPQKALSLKDLCQGIAVTAEGKFVMTSSYSISDSTIYYFNNVLEEENAATTKIGLTEIPMWYLDDNSLIYSEKIPSMAEEVVIRDDRVYILFESSCKKYKKVNRTRIDSVYSLPITYFEK